MLDLLLPGVLRGSISSLKGEFLSVLLTALFPAGPRTYYMSTNIY